jgi:hypothetical protein
MPVWLAVILGVWSAILPLVAVSLKWGRSLTAQVLAISQWFDPSSALGQQHGTLPGQVRELREDINTVVGKERVVERLASVENRVSAVEAIVGKQPGEFR